MFLQTQIEPSTQHRKPNWVIALPPVALFTNIV